MAEGPLPARRIALNTASETLRRHALGIGEDPRTAGTGAEHLQAGNFGQRESTSSARKEGKPAVEGGGAPLLLSGHGAAKAWPKAEAVYKGVEAETRHPLHEVW